MTSTPRYLLLNEGQRIRPQVALLPSGLKWSFFYGFSNKDRFDTFISNSPLHLVPHPLVKVHLRNDLEAQGVDLTLVVIDASGPGDSEIVAATIEVVLQAHEDQLSQIIAAYRMTFDQKTETYQVNEASF